MFIPLACSIFSFFNLHFGVTNLIFSKSTFRDCPLKGAILQGLSMLE